MVNAHAIGYVTGNACDDDFHNDNAVRNGSDCDYGVDAGSGNDEAAVDGNAVGNDVGIANDSAHDGGNAFDGGIGGDGDTATGFDNAYDRDADVDSDFAGDPHHAYGFGVGDGIDFDSAHATTTASTPTTTLATPATSPLLVAFSTL